MQSAYFNIRIKTEGIGHYLTQILYTKMVLSSEQIKSLIKTPRNAANIQKAIEHEDRLRFHTQVITDTLQINSDNKIVETFPDLPYYTKFLTWVKSILTASDKYEQFKKLLVFPLKTNEVVDSCSDEYMKVFEAEDSYMNIEFSDKKLLDDFNDYLKTLNDTEFWHNKAFNAMIKAINCIVIIDLPAQQTTERPEPYFYLLDIRNVIDIGYNDKEEIEYIIFKSGKDKIAVFDEVFYRLYQIDEKNKENIYLIVESPHLLGFCPARPFWSDTLDDKNLTNKQAPLSTMLERLDWLLFFETAKQALDIYAGYPIYWAYQSKCDYKDHRGHECQGGVLTYYDDTSAREVVVPCPVCESKKITGPGSLIEAPVPRGEMKVTVPPAGVIPIEKNSLDYNTNEAERLKAQIYAGATGKQKLIQKEAVNEDQVQAQFESQTNILNYIARNFEKVKIWTYSTLARLRYGDSFVSCSISYGTSFYLQTLDSAIKDYNDSKTAGVPFYILLGKISKIENLQYKNNPVEKNRLEILKHLEPYPLLTLQECVNYGFNSIDKEGFVLKANFANFVVMFELEFGSIIEFGSALSMEGKINKIKLKLYDYVRKQLNVSAPETGSGQETGSQTRGQTPGPETGSGERRQDLREQG